MLFVADLSLVLSSMANSLNLAVDSRDFTCTSILKDLVSVKWQVAINGQMIDGGFTASCLR